MEQDESHHHMFRKKIEDVTVLVTRTSHSRRDIDDKLARLMANQLCLQQSEFWDLVDCPLEEEGWNELIAERRAGGRNPFLGR